MRHRLMSSLGQNKAMNQLSAALPLAHYTLAERREFLRENDA